MPLGVYLENYSTKSEAEWISHDFTALIGWFVSGKVPTCTNYNILQLTVKRCDSPNKAIDSDHHGSYASLPSGLIESMESCMDLLSGRKAFHWCTWDIPQISEDYIKSCSLVKVWDLYNYIYIHTYSILIYNYIYTYIIHNYIYILIYIYTSRIVLAVWACSMLLGLQLHLYRNIFLSKSSDAILGDFSIAKAAQGHGGPLMSGDLWQISTVFDQFESEFVGLNWDFRT